MSHSDATAALRASDAKRFLAGAPLSATDSISVFHAPHDGHFPSHLGLVPPQSLQV